MKKSDVKISYHQGSRGEPMVNVKRHLWVPDLIAKYEGTGAHECSGDTEFWSWLREVQDDREVFDEVFELADEWARENCWEWASDYAHQIWPDYSTEMVHEKVWSPEHRAMRFTGRMVPRKRYHVNVYSAGRSGGWCVVSGLPDVESWDAIELGRWRKFQRFVETLRDEEYGYQFIWQLAVNVFEQHREGWRYRLLGRAS